MTNDLQQKAVEFFERWKKDPVNKGETWGTREVLAEFAADFAAAEIARERAEIGDELERITNGSSCEVNLLIATLRGEL